MRPSLAAFVVVALLIGCSSDDKPEGSTRSVCQDLRAIYELPAPMAPMDGDEVRQVLAQTEAVNAEVTRGAGPVRDAFRVLAQRQEALLRFAADRADERGTVGDLNDLVSDFEDAAGHRDEWSDAAVLLNAKRRDCGLSNTGTTG